MIKTPNKYKRKQKTISPKTSEEKKKESAVQILQYQAE